MEDRKAELESAVAAQKEVEAHSQTVLNKIQSFFKDFQEMDVIQAKALLQGIVKTAHVYNDGRIELEFRS